MAVTQSSELFAVLCFEIADSGVKQKKMDLNRDLPTVIKFYLLPHLKLLITLLIILLLKNASRSFSSKVGQVYLKDFLCCTLEKLSACLGTAKLVK